MSTVHPLEVIDDTHGRELHAKSTGGETLTGAEQAHLQAWYDRKDEEESRLLARPPLQTDLIPFLRSEIEASLSRLAMVTQRIQSLMDENDGLRREITSLHEQLAREQSLQVA